jgi:hypothetical protein
MRKLMLIIFLVATPAFAQDQAAVARAAAGCGPSQEMFDVKTDDTKHPVGQPEEGKALVYFFVDFVTAPTMRVGVDGQWVGANNGKSYFFFQVEPGNTMFVRNGNRAHSRRRRSESGRRWS